MRHHQTGNRHKRKNHQREFFASKNSGIVTNQKATADSGGRSVGRAIQACDWGRCKRHRPSISPSPTIHSMLLSPHLNALTTLPDRSPMTPGELHQLSRMDGDEVLHNWATEAGWGDVVVATIERLVELPPLRTQFVNHLSARPWSTRSFALSPEDRSSALDGLLEPLNSYVQPDGTAKIPTTSYLVTGVA